MPHDDLERVLALVDQERRALLKRLVVGAAAVTGVTLAAVPLMTTQSLAQKEGEDPVDGKCDEGLVVSKKTGKCAVPKKKGG